MRRPEIELFLRRARGYYGHNWVVQMNHVGMIELLEYVQELENNQCKCRSEDD